MPSRQSLKDATTPVEISRGDAKIVLHAALEKVTAHDKKYKELFTASVKITAEINQLQQVEIQAEIDGLAAPKKLDAATVNEFMTAMGGILKDCEEEAISSHALSVAREKLDAFGAALMPSEDDLNGRVKDVEKKIKDIRAKIDKKTEELYRSYAERLAYLVTKWDVTETEAPDSPMVPVTAEELMTFSGVTIVNMMEEVEKKVQGR